MKRVSLLIGFGVVLLMVGGISVPNASGQPKLDNIWFKTDIDLKGFQYDLDGNYKRKNGKTIAYLKFTWNAVNEWYDVAVYTGPGNDIWEQTATNKAWTFPRPDGAEAALDWIDIELHPQPPDYMWVGFTDIIQYKNNGKVKIEGTGYAFGGLGAEHNWAGYSKITMQSVTVDKLPFTPQFLATNQAGLAMALPSLLYCSAPRGFKRAFPPGSAPPVFPAIPDSEIYDPQNNSWEPVASLHTARGRRGEHHWRWGNFRTERLC